jgi:hypothetical protein
MGYLGNYGGTFGESALTPASNHAEATLVVKILLIREIAVLLHGRFEVRLTAACRHAGDRNCCPLRSG